MAGKQPSRPERLRPSRRPSHGNGHDTEPCAHGSYEVLIDSNNEPKRLICADCGRRWPVSDPRPADAEDENEEAQ